MKKTSQIIIKTTIISMIVFSVFGTIYAKNSNDYTLLAPLPGISVTRENCTGTDCKTTLEKYLPGAFSLAIGIAVAMAFVVITWGGIVYATSDAITGKEQGKEWVSNAVWGLLLVIGAWVILNTLNPKILEFNLSIKRPNIPVGVPTATLGVRMTNQELTDHEAVKARLIGVKVNAGACDVGQVSACTNLNGLPDNAINGLNALKIACVGYNVTTGCDVTITGGTEGGHLTHGAGTGAGAGAPIVDLGKKDPYFNNYIYTNKLGPPVKTDIGLKYTLTINGRGTTFLDEGDHWHVVFQ